MSIIRPPTDQETQELEKLRVTLTDRLQQAIDRVKQLEADLRVARAAQSDAEDALSDLNDAW